VNGCPNSCARFQVADIGLMSALARRPDGTKSDAFLVHLGGALGDGDGADGASFGRKVKGVRVFAEDTADYVETLVKRYRARRGAEGPSFTEFVRGMDEDELTVFATPEGGR
jgi:sulfite reductase (ferredoxin)